MLSNYGSTYREIEKNGKGIIHKFIYQNHQDETVKAQFQQVIDQASGRSAIEILNSRDHGDPWGDPNVSRVIITGQEIGEPLGIVGILSCLAHSVDVGNFNTEETAFVSLYPVGSTLVEEGFTAESPRSKDGVLGTLDDV